jgi:hypothetical protein
MNTNERNALTQWKASALAHEMKAGVMLACGATREDVEPLLRRAEQHDKIARFLRRRFNHETHDEDRRTEGDAARISERQETKLEVGAAAAPESQVRDGSGQAARNAGA